MRRTQARDLLGPNGGQYGSRTVPLRRLPLLTYSSRAAARVAHKWATQQAPRSSIATGTIDIVAS